MDYRAGPNNHTGPNCYGGPRFTWSGPWSEVNRYQNVFVSETFRKYLVLRTVLNNFGPIYRSSDRTPTGLKQLRTNFFRTLPDQIWTGGPIYLKICRSIAEIGQEPLQNTPTVGVLDKKQLEAAMKAQVANQSAKMEKLNQVLLKSMTKMKLKIEEQKKELDKNQKDFEVRIKAHPKLY